MCPALVLGVDATVSVDAIASVAGAVVMATVLPDTRLSNDSVAGAVVATVSTDTCLSNDINCFIRAGAGT